MLKKLQKKFIILTTGISVAVLLVIAATINVANYLSIANRSEEVLDLLIENNMSITDNFGALERFSQEIAFTTRYFVVRVDAENNVGLIDTSMISSVTSDQAAVYAQDVYQSGSEEGIIGNFRFTRTVTEYGYTYVFLDIEEELRNFNDFLLYTTIIVMAAVVFIFLLSMMFSKRAVSPIVESYERQKRFITDVSHELKTPLAIIKADSDVIEIEAGESDWTTSIKTQVTRVNTLVENLITLTKLDEEKQVITKTNFNLSGIIAGVVDEFSASAKNASVAFSGRMIADIYYQGEESSIAKLIEILVENAIKYSKPNTMIVVSLTERGSKKIFTIENAVECITVGKHNNWFDRFYREDAARNSESKGYGIGLSIAKAICDKHDAKISAESKTGQEIIITVVF